MNNLLTIVDFSTLYSNRCTVSFQIWLFGDYLQQHV